MSNKSTKELITSNRILASFVVVLALSLGISVGNQRGWLVPNSQTTSVTTQSTRVYLGQPIRLPSPNLSSSFSIEQALKNRRSRRSYTNKSLVLDDLAQLLWALQGKTADWGGRTAPSAKASYPLEVTLIAKNVEDLDPAVYHYDPETHSISKTIDGIPALFDEAAFQNTAQTSPIVILLSGNLQRMTDAFEGVAHDENVYLEAGHAGQNLYLQAESLSLGTTVIKTFNHDLMMDELKIPSTEILIYLIPVGSPTES